MTNNKNILIHRDLRGVVTVTLNRPEIHNAFDEHMIQELLQAFQTLSKDTSVRMLVLKGAGKSFCAGGDLDWMRRLATYTDSENKQDALLLAQMMDALDRFPRPTIAVIQGASIGGGVGLTCCCDMVLAESSAYFSLSEVRLGLIPAVIGPYVLRAMGPRQVRRYFLSCEKISAPKAKELGLVHECLPKEEMDQALEALIQSCLEGAPVAQGQAKVLLHDLGKPMSLEDMMEYTAQAIADMRGAPEAKEGIAAFFNKQLPGWRQ